MPGPDPTPEEQRAKGERALKNLLSSHEKIVKGTEDLADAIGDEEQGLVAVMSDLIDELQLHREAMTLLTQAIMKSGGINLDIGGILGGGRGRTRR